MFFIFWYEATRGWFLCRITKEPFYRSYFDAKASVRDISRTHSLKIGKEIKLMQLITHGRKPKDIKLIEVKL